MNYLKNIYTLIFLLITGIGLDAQTSTVSGKIVARDGEPMENITLTITTSSQTLTTTTDELGNYSFADIAIDAIISVVPSRDINPLNGVSTFDVVLASKHILGLTPFDSADEYIAMDVNQSGSITVLDGIMIRQLILNLISEVPNVPSWRFVEEKQLEVIAFDQSEMPEYNTTIPALDLTLNNNGSLTLNFIGIKIGDANGNARP